MHPSDPSRPSQAQCSRPPTLPQACRRRLQRLGAGLTLGVVAAGTAGAAELVVRVSGLSAPFGDVGCALFAAEAGFPMDNGRARMQWLPALAEGTVCRFDGVAPGRYAVSIAHDRNGNRRVDTSLFGLPTEPWAVSNNARPALRAPRFDEAAFNVPSDRAEVAFDIRVAP